MHEEGVISIMEISKIINAYEILKSHGFVVRSGDGMVVDPVSKAFESRVNQAPLSENGRIIHASDTVPQVNNNVAILRRIPISNSRVDTHMGGDYIQVGDRSLNPNGPVKEISIEILGRNSTSGDL